jgi:pyroglutamyl-peptidase
VNAPRVLITAFEAFEGETLNPSLEIALRLDQQMIAGHRVEIEILPVAFADTHEPLRRRLLACEFALVIGLGLAGGRSSVSLERVAINLIDARIADNRGAQPIDQAIVPDGPAAYFSTLPVKAMRQALVAAGIPAQISFSAGSYVCNQVFYLLLHELGLRCSGARAGFIHLPYLPAQAAAHPGAASMALDTQVAAIERAIAAALATPDDLQLVGGSTH